jgi:hypothetical protein
MSTKKKLAARKQTRPTDASWTLKEYISDLNSRIPDSSDTTAEGLFNAIKLWRFFPSELEVVIGVFSPSFESTPDLHWARLEIEHCRHRSAELMMQHAERLGIESGSLLTSATLCRDLMRKNPQSFYHPKRYSDAWPACLVPARAELTTDQQSIITRSEETLARLCSKFNLKAQSRRRTKSKNAAAGCSLT